MYLYHIVMVVVPTIEELELFTASELQDKLLEARAAGDPAAPVAASAATASSKQAVGGMVGKDESNEPRRELATMLYHLLVDQKTKADAASAAQAQIDEEGTKHTTLTISYVSLFVICCLPSILVYAKHCRRICHSIII